MPRCDITPKALIAYEFFLRHIDLHTHKRYNAKAHEALRKKLTSFIGERGQYSVLEKSDNRRTSKMSAPRGERGQADARRNGVEDPKISTTASNSASDTDAPAAAGGRGARKPTGFYRV